jgi:hypothetical protein
MDSADKLKRTMSLLLKFLISSFSVSIMTHNDLYLKSCMAMIFKLLLPAGIRTKHQSQILNIVEIQVKSLQTQLAT